MQYLDFEGNIPKGEYGGGAMIVWDRGRWEPRLRSRQGAREGPSRLRAARRAAPRPLASGAHAAAARREERAMAADQGRGRIRAPGRRAGDHRGGDHLVAQRPDHPGARRAGRVAQGPRRPRQGDRRAQDRRCPTRRQSRRPQGHPAGLPRAEPAAADRQGRRAARNGCTRSSTTATASQARIDGPEVQLLTRKGLDWTARFPSIAAALEDSARAPRCSTARSSSRTPPAFRASPAAAGGPQRGPQRSLPLLRCSTFSIAKGSTSPRRRCCDRKALLQRDRQRPARRLAASASASISRRTGRRCSSTPAASASKASCRSASICRTGPGAATIGSRPRACCGRSSSSSATCPRPPPRARSARCCSATTTRASSTTPAASAPAIRLSSRRLLRTQLDKIAAAKPKLAQRAARRRREGRALGGAATRLRGRVSRLDRRPICPPGVVQGAARGPSAPKRSCSTWRPRRRKPARARDTAGGAAHPSRTHPVARAGRHQAGPRRVLHRHRRLDPAAHDGARAEPGALPLRGRARSASSPSMPGQGLGTRCGASTSARRTRC